MSDGLEEVVAELERVAGRLRAGDVDPAEAAELVERCAELAGRVGGELERRARGGAGDGPPAQERLL